MSRYFLSELMRQRFELRARWSFLSEDSRDGHIRLFNKNSGATFHPLIVQQCTDRFGWIVECDSVPDYFLHVLQPENE